MTTIQTAIWVPLFALAFRPGVVLAQAGPSRSNTDASEAPVETSDGPIPSLSESLTGTAKAEYEAARILYDDGDFTGALNKLELAHRSSGDPRLLWNMAAAEKNLRHYARVKALIERYLASKSPLITEQDREKAELLLDTVKDFVSTVTFEISPPGALLTVDDAELGKAPLPGPTLLDFGKRKLSVTLSGYEPHEEVLDLEGGSVTRYAIRLKEEVTTGTLRVVTDPHTTIRVDARVVGTGLWQGAMAAGAHTIHLEAVGKVPQTTEIVVEKGSSRTVNILLSDETVASHDSGIPAWLWVTGGVAAAAALGTGAYFVFRDDSPESSPEMGSWGGIEL